MGKKGRGKNKRPLDRTLSDVIEEIRESGRYVEVKLDRITGHKTRALSEAFAYCVPGDDSICLLPNGTIGDIERIPFEKIGTQIGGIEIVSFGLIHPYGCSNTRLGYIGNHK